MAAPVITSADWHLSNDDPYAEYDKAGVSNFLKLKCLLLKKLIAHIIALKGYLVVAGDLLDSRTPDNNTLYYSSRAVAGMADIEFVLLLEGNHGFDARNSNIGVISHWEHFVPDNVHIVTTPQKIERSPYDFYCIPAVADITDSFASIAKDFIGSIKKSRTSVLVAHGPISGALFDTGTSSNEGIKMDAVLEASKYFDHVVFGDFHRYQTIADNIWYCGSPMQVSLRDKGQRKGYQIFDDTSAGHEFHALPGPRFYDLEWDLDGKMPSVLERPADYKKKLKKAVVIVRLKGSASARSSVDIDGHIKSLKENGAMRVVPRWIDKKSKRKASGINPTSAIEEMISKYVGANPSEDVDSERLVHAGISYTRQ